MMRKVVLALTASGLAIGLSGCSGMSKTLGLDKSAPDEFTVAAKPPLVLPPNYSLKPPAPGTQLPRTVDSRQKAIEALFPEGLENPKVSSGEAGLLRRTGAVAVDGTVRQRASDDQTNVVEKGGVTKTIVDSPDVAGAVPVERVESRQLPAGK